MLYKRGVLKNFSKFSDKHKTQSSGGVLSKDVLKNFEEIHSKNILAGVSLLTKLQAGNLKSTEPAAGDSLENKVFLEFLQISLGKNMFESFFEKVGVLRAYNFIKEDSNTGLFL